MSAVTESKYTRESNAIIDAETHPELRSVMEELRARIEEIRQLANGRLSGDQSYEARREAKRRRLWATNAEKLIIDLHNFRSGLGEWAPGGRYATPEYLARRELEEVSA